MCASALMRARVRAAGHALTLLRLCRVRHARVPRCYQTAARAAFCAMLPRTSAARVFVVAQARVLMRVMRHFADAAAFVIAAATPSRCLFADTSPLRYATSLLTLALAIYFILPFSLLMFCFRYCRSMFICRYAARWFYAIRHAKAAMPGLRHVTPLLMSATLE